MSRLKKKWHWGYLWFLPAIYFSAGYGEERFSIRCPAIITHKNILQDFTMVMAPNWESAYRFSAASWVQPDMNCNWLKMSFFPGCYPLVNDTDFSEKLSQTKKAVYPSGIHPERLAIVGSTVLLANWAIYQSFQDVWWNREKSKFHFYRGWHRSSGYWDLGPHDSLWFHMDKLGHIYCARIFAQTFSDLGHWIGMTPGRACWTGAFVGSILMLEIELYDSQFKDWGFSVGDFLANEIGAFLPLMKYRFPILNELSFKLSYTPSARLSGLQYAVEDYAGMTFWLSVPFYKALPFDVQSVWPEFLNIALGYSITRKAHGETELYLALDYDLTKCAPQSGIIGKLIRQLNYIHLPAPAIRLRPDGHAYLLYF